ncbi:putative UPF0481 protein At3g02645 [Gastrolobium bilobum]|uniref:putative UPF0481 protein At3g02645 n=1 Tax=Gastrolobium bilobum TaxID=150636 RepID=UPI002AAF662A|nr:putative UPF0481 protein At3g02645 [Gastrolobium bilobum]
MASDEAGNSITRNTNTDKEDLVLINIKEFMKSEELNHEAVCVYRVPKSLSSAKSEAFTPQFVGLGPYHHSRPEFYKLKLSTAKRMLNDFTNYAEKKLKELKLAPTIRDCYDGNIAFKDDTLLYLMIVDALFLYQFLHNHSLESKEEGVDITLTQLNRNISIFTEKQGTPLVNAAGVEFTKYAIVSDVFMLENQIPTCILKSIMKDLNVDEHLGSAMLDFCTKFCPIHTNKSKDVNNVHLLDLMYHLIVPPEPEHQPEPNNDPEPEPQSRPDSQKTQTTCWDLFSSIPVYLLLICFVMICAVLLILELIFWVLSFLFGLLLKLVGFCSPVFDELHKLLTTSNFKVLKPYATFVEQTRGTFKFFQESKNMDASLAVMIPSAMELDKAGIHLHPTNGGISSIEFDVTKCQFDLPSIRLDVNSEVIIRNLVAYESLIKSKYLIFTRYTELMSAIINTSEDVKLLVHKKIIQTELSDEVVAQLFNGMSKSIRPTKTPQLDEEIKKVKDKFDSTQKLYRVMTKYGGSCWKFFIVVAALVFFVLSVVQTICSVITCNRTSRFGNVLEYRDYGRNNNFSSI